MGKYTATNLPNDGESIDAADVNTDLQGIIDEFNGNIENDNIKSTAAIAFSKLATDAWTANVPAWTGATTNPVIGNGVLIGRSIKIGRIVTFSFVIIAGSTTTFGSGQYAISLPYTAATVTNQVWSGIAAMYDANNVDYLGKICVDSAATTLNISLEGATNKWGPTAPFTMVDGDQVDGTVTYESAA